MSRETVKDPQPELLLAGLLRYGTWLASGVTGLGLAMSLGGVEGHDVEAAGVALFIASGGIIFLDLKHVFDRMDSDGR